MQTYYIVRPKHGLVLDSNLHWKRAMECSGNGPGFALGLEMADALNVASWASFEGVSAVPYPEATACSHFKKSVDGPFLLRKKDFSHQEFADAVSQKIYPEFLLRKPLNKAEKKLLFGKFAKGEKLGDAKGKIPLTPTKKKDLRGDCEYSKGVENVFYIVNTKKGLFLTKTLSWVGISALRADKKLKSQLFTVRDDISVAQNLAHWMMPPGETASPCTPSTLKKKYRLVLPNPTSDSLVDGIRSHRLPSFLARKPESRREIAAFQLALRDGLFGLEERTLLSLGQIPETGTEEELGSDAQPHIEQDNTNGSDSPDIPLEPEYLLSGDPVVRERERFGFQCKVASVCETSDLIRDFVETAVTFGKMLNDVASLTAQRRLDLDIIQKQLVDLDHVTEFYSMNASDGYRLNKTRKDFLQRRRIIKNELAVLDMISNYLGDGATPAKINRFVNAVMGLDHRIYTTRVMTVEDIKNLIRNPKTQEVILGSHEPAAKVTELLPSSESGEEVEATEKVSA